MRTAFVYTDQYSDFDYGPEHPLRVERLGLTFRLCSAYGLFDLPEAALVRTVPAEDQEILRFHTPIYLKVLKIADTGEFRGVFKHGLGEGDNPVFAGLWEWSRLTTGASLQCARLVSGGSAAAAFNIAGGLHHARADEAAGFCYVNDPVVSIYPLLDQGYRVMYLDIDAHHGDGVQGAFYEDPRVLTVSFHQDGRTLFPGTGRVHEMGKGEGKGYSVNVPMLPGADDEVFRTGFFETVPRIMARFRPDVVVSQLGVDTLYNDPLTDLEMTTNGFCEAVDFLIRQDIPLIALGGGGYHVGNVARAFTLAWAIMNNVDLPEDLPETMTGPPFPFEDSGQSLRDGPHRSERRERCMEYMKDCLKYLERNVLPLIS